MEALDAAETAFHQVGKQIVAVKLAGMREHRQPAVLHDDPHGVARVHVVDIAVADAAVLEQAAIQRAALGYGSLVSAAMRCCLYRHVDARPSSSARSTSTS